MTMTPAQLRRDLPAFKNPAIYTDESIQFWITFATNMMTQSSLRWGVMFDQGVELYAAHNLILEKQASDTAARGGTPGINTGPVNNKSVDKVSIGYDTASGIELEAGHWNLTTYGTRFIRIAGMMGTGGFQSC